MQYRPRHRKRLHLSHRQCSVSQSWVVWVWSGEGWKDYKFYRSSSIVIAIILNFILRLQTTNVIVYVLDLNANVALFDTHVKNGFSVVM